MKTSAEIQEAINELRQKRTKQIEIMLNYWTSPLELKAAREKREILETRISDLTIALELAKEKDLL